MKKVPNIINYHELDGLHELALGNKKEGLRLFQAGKRFKNESQGNPLYLQSVGRTTTGEERAEYQRRIAQLKGVANP